MAATTHRHGRKAFGKDTGLQARMVLTMFLLGLVYVVLVGVLIAVGAGGVTILVIALALLALQLFASDKIAMGTMGVKEVSPAEEPELHGIIERLCVQADLPKPRVCVMENAMPNAFAMGRSQKAATVCATRGILQLLSPAELEGVMAHELTHVINRDVMVMTLASFFATRRLDHRAVRLLLRRRLRRGLRPRQQRRRGGRVHRDHGRDGGVRDLLHAAARALALPRVRRRPRLGGADRAAPRRWPRRC